VTYLENYSLLLEDFIAGLVATGFMTILQIPIRLKFGLESVLEWHENQVISSKIFGDDVNNMFSTGLLFHFLNGGLAGMAYPFLLSIFGLNSFNIYNGIIYGILLWFSTLALIHKRLTGIPIINHPKGYLPIYFSIGLHIIYGLFLVIIIQVI